MANSLGLGEFEDLIIVSDLHMGDGTHKDNFLPYKKEFDEFLREEVAASGKNKLILAGDTFEFWQSFHSKIITRNFDTLKALIDNRAIFIVGNHDIDLIDFVGFSFGLEFFDLLAKDLQFEIAGKKFFVCHGHEFDKFNDPGRHLVWGRMCALFAGWVEMKVGREIGGKPTEECLLFLGNQILKFVKWIIGKNFKTPSQQKKLKKVVHEYIEEAKKIKDREKADVIISGHTHLPGIFENWYFNSGSWQKKPLTYVRINKDGECNIFEWPSKRVINKDLSRVETD